MPVVLVSSMVQTLAKFVPHVTDQHGLVRARWLAACRQYARPLAYPGPSPAAARSVMESKVKLLGHPVHPMLIVLPLGLFIAAVVFDALCLWRGNPTFGLVG